MNKKLLLSALLLGNFAAAIPALAQNGSVVPEAPLPNYTFSGGATGPVVRPQNASASTMQEVVGPSGSIENLYIHSWDVFSSPNYNGIAWRRTDASGSLINEDYIPVKYAEDIDAVIYEDGGAYYVLAAYYYNDGDPLTRGHYYDIYKFDVTGLVPVTTWNLLTNSSTFGRINVDATSYGLAIVWSIPFVGIHTTTSFFPGVSFGPNVLLPGTDDKVDPDVCIRRGGGGSGTGLDLQIAFLNSARNSLYEYRLPFFNALAGSPAGFTLEYNTGTVGTNQYNPPRIDCPDVWNTQRWAVSFGINNISGSSNMEWVYAAIKNEDWSTSVATVNLSFASYTTNGPELCNPVVAYSDECDRVIVGWITKQNTTVLPGTNDVKYVAKDIKDVGGAAPVVIPSSYNMISNTPGSHEPVLAFSGQNRNSSFVGLYTAFSQYATVFPNDYSMMSKTRKWSLGTFRGTAEFATDKAAFTVSPNPFTNTLNFQAPGAGAYKVSLFSIDGRMVYDQASTLTEGQQFQFDTDAFASGTYIIKVLSLENGINYTQKIVKK